MPQVKLSKLFSEFTPIPALSADFAVSGIAVDSRLIQPGELFVATSDNIDGHRFIPEALDHGAAAVIGTQALEDLGVPYIQVEDSRKALALISAAFFDHPSRKLTLIGVTGTDGKTTTANLLYQIMVAAGLRVGMISTVNAVIGGKTLDTGFHVTTPEAYDVQNYLAQMVSAGLTHAVLEATSHGLAARRLLGSQFDLAVVTNITHEHLDFHGSYAEYRAAKARLFTGLADGETKQNPIPRAAILNRDDISYDYLAEVSSVTQISYGLHESAQVRAEAITQTIKGLQFTALTPNFNFPIECNLVGDYNVSNCLAAGAACAVGLGLDVAAVTQGIANLTGVPGRMERIDLGQDFSAIVDFAHTPNGLKRALEASRKLTGGRIIAVFGSAGLRDRAKRRLMAEISAQLADLTILTAEDPRTDSLEEILADMAVGARAKGGVEAKTFWRIPDRGDAIRFAVEQAQPGDLVLALGKGHEQSMCFGETEYPWDDRTALRAALAEHLGVEGPEMPYLPTQN